MRLTLFKQLLELASSIQSKSQVNRYLVESSEKVKSRFEVLNWQKVNCARYCVVLKITRNILAIPISTVALNLHSTQHIVYLNFFRVVCLQL